LPSSNPNSRETRGGQRDSSTSFARRFVKQEGGIRLVIPAVKNEKDPVSRRALLACPPSRRNRRWTPRPKIPLPQRASRTTSTRGEYAPTARRLLQTPPRRPLAPTSSASANRRLSLHHAVAQFSAEQGIDRPARLLEEEPLPLDPGTFKRRLDYYSALSSPAEGRKHP